MSVELSYWKLVAPHWDRISIHNGPGGFLREFADTPEPNRHLFAAHWCQSEVCNGGLDLFFSNSTGVLAPEAVAAFNAIGLPGLASVVQRAMALLGKSYPRDREARNEVLDRLQEVAESNPFDSLDVEFSKLVEEEGGGWEASANKYAASHGG